VSKKDIARITKAIDFVSPHCKRPEWVRYLMAIKAVMGEEGRELAEAWSAKSDKFNDRDFDSTWRSIKAAGGITGATVFKEARRFGWAPSKDETDDPPATTKPPVIPVQKPIYTTFPLALQFWAEAMHNEDPSLSRNEHVARHSYAIRKKVEWAAGALRGLATGSVVGYQADCILIPQWTYPKKHFCGLECINVAGKKQTFGKKGLVTLRDDRDEGLPRWVCEGWATGAHLFKLSHCVVYISGSKGMLKKTYAAVKARHPKSFIKIAGEVDG